MRAGVGVNESKRERWARVRERGMLYYIVVYWVLGWGLFTGVVWGTLMAALDFGEWLQMIYAGILLFPLLGWPAGALAWHIYDARFQRGPGDA
jgi:uncharacterized membrane protein YczE